MTCLLALDPSTTAIGWALFDVETDALLTSGVWRPPRKAEFDERCAAACLWLYKRLSGVDAFAYEIPVVRHNPRTTVMLAEFSGALRSLAWVYVKRIIRVLPAERLTAFGLPWNVKRAEAKRLIVQYVNLRYGLGLTEKEHDVADAVAVGVAAMSRLKEEEIRQKT